jgi:DNA-directed RNA polymerase specialized sigma24 family protein
MEATHRQIADVLGISAGTVSSSLYLLKSHWGMDEKGNPLKKGKKTVH